MQTAASYGSKLAGALTSQQVIALQWWLPGLASAAVWIGSNGRWSPPQSPRLDLCAYLRNAGHCALTAVNNAGLTSPEPSRQPVLDPDWQPSPMQATCAGNGLFASFWP
ncbi:hypothetical protein [Paracoccus halophilus]|uniref:hypothetical protein n=1 Tax=Paracoccus halophilus TaxID=376733 RepID=UPI0011135D05|nr:hypothetical protein [Paracoccus halophilus]